MIIVSCNCKGMGSMAKRAMKDIITTKKHDIFMLQETKANEKEMETMNKKPKIIKEPQSQQPEPQEEYALWKTENWELIQQKRSCIV